MTDPRYRSVQDIDQTQSRARVGKFPDTDFPYASASHFDTSIPRTSHSLPCRDDGKDESFSMHARSKLHTSQPLPTSIDPGFVPSFVLSNCPPILPAYTASALYHPLNVNHAESRQDAPEGLSNAWMSRTAADPSFLHRYSDSGYMDEATESQVDGWAVPEPQAMDADAEPPVPDIYPAVAAPIAAGPNCLYRSFDRYSNTSSPSIQPAAPEEFAAAWSAGAKVTRSSNSGGQTFAGFQPVPDVTGYQQSRPLPDTPPLIQNCLSASSHPFMPSIFPDRNSPAALRLSNQVMGGLVLPGA